MSNATPRDDGDPMKNLKACIASRERWIKSANAISGRFRSAQEVAAAMVDDLRDALEDNKDNKQASEVVLVLKAQIDALETWQHYVDVGIQSSCLPLGSCTCHAYMFGE